MEKFFDLSRAIEHGQAVYPGDEETELIRSRHLAKDGFNNHRLRISMHSGTHIDGPMHLTESGTYIDEIDIGSFIGKGILLDVRGETEIRMKSEYEKEVPLEAIVLFWTGRDLFFGSEDYFVNNPYLTMELAEFLVKRRTRLVGFDSSSPDRYPFDIHRILFNGGCLIAENLTGFERIANYEHIKVFAIPLKIHADSSVARVFAVAE